MFLRYRFWLPGIAVACTFVPAPTLAQSSASAASAPENDVLEEIIVTAQKRSERLQDVPVSVATLTGEPLQTLFAAGGDVLMLAARVPGEDESAGKATPWLRRRESSLVDTCCTRSGMPGRGEAGDLREEAERPQHVCLRPKSRARNQRASFSATWNEQKHERE